MSPSRQTSMTAAMLCLLAGIFALAASSAQALVAHSYLAGVSAEINQGIPTEGPHGEKIASAGPLRLGPLSLTVDSGHLLAVEGGERIDEFDAATGAFLSQLAIKPEGTFFSFGNSGTAGIGVGHSTGKALVYVGERTSAGPAVGVYDESGALAATWTGAGTPQGSFGHAELDVATDDSTDPLDEHKGDVFVATSPASTESVPPVVDIFHPEADGKEHYVGQITGPSSSEPFKSVDRVAVSGTNGDVVVIANQYTLYVYEPGALGEYALAHTISGTPVGTFSDPFNLTIDEGSGEIYVDDLGGPEFNVVIDQFSGAGTYLGRITGTDTPNGHIGDAYDVAVDPASHNVFVGDEQFGEMDVFGGNIVFPDVTSGAASNVAPASVTLNGTVNPDSAGAATCRFEWGTSKLFGKTAACEPEGVAEGGVPVAVQATLTGLTSDTTYFYRLQATNANGVNPGEASQDQEVTTPGPGIREASVTNLSATSATFEASIAPHNVSTSVYFQYGTTAAYGTDVPTAPGEAIGAGNGAVDTTPHHVQGLAPDTVYHYRVVVVTEPEPGVVVVFAGPDQVFRTQGAAVSELPDGRQWEMVSPPDKKGARIFGLQEMGVIQAAADGDGIAYLTDVPTENEPAGFSNDMQVLSTRLPGGWGTRNIGLVHPDAATGPSTGQGFEYRLFSPDLTSALVQPPGNFVPSLSAEASEQTGMLRSLDPSCGSSCDRPLVTGKPGFANVAPGTVFGEEPNGECEVLYCGPYVYAATSDLSHIVVRSSGLNPSIPWSEWTNGQLTPIEPPFENAGVETENVRGAISNDGSRIILTEGGGSALFVRDIALGKTVQLDVPEAACVTAGKCPGGGTTFQLASADGSKVFFTSKPLTRAAGQKGVDLYECEMIETAGELECQRSEVAKEAVGVVGASEDGSYLYFVSNSVLAEGAIPGSCEAGETAVPGATCNLYVRHGGVMKLVAIVSAEDSHDWQDALSGATGRVSADGNWLEFMSQQSVTGYDNRDAVSGRADAEVYLYDASGGRTVCASCDPTGARPTGLEYQQLEAGFLAGGPRGTWPSQDWVAANVPGWAQTKLGATSNQPRYLSDSGRLFFNSRDALVPQDVNGTEDVYEWEPSGVGGCSSTSITFSEGTDGCVGLISSGTSAQESAFLDASEDGGDVFFLTYSRLQPQDYDNALDVYDAHECISGSPCFPAAVPQPPACITADACRVAPLPQPTNFAAPASSTFSGTGNVTPSKPSSVRRLTRAQKLVRALKACRKKPKRERGACEKHARKLYGAVKSNKAASKKKGDR